MITRCGIALGSNLNSPHSQILEGVRLLRQIAEPEQAFLEASIYRTAPLDCPDGSPEFLNTVVEIGWAGTPRQLLEITRQIEVDAGRRRSGVRNAPRTLDLDLIYCGNLVIDEPDLQIPHPRAMERRFVLVPLAEIRPALILPGQGLSVAELLARLPEQPSESVIPL
ncbi:MAG: 2-amino-4-hydroxy-6-hydroxymethyldihydropteridine diphosphokinase [Luteolibacter sp.]